VISFENDGNGGRRQAPRIRSLDSRDDLRASANLQLRRQDREENRRRENGFGFKLVLIWSEFGSETIDHVRGSNTPSRSTATSPRFRASNHAHENHKTVHTGDVQARLRSSETHGHQRRHAVAPQKRIYDIGAVTDHSVKRFGWTTTGRRFP
jgi:hypothetical protein